jgi:ABC-2 type transport system ATP-binding protein
MTNNVYAIIVENLAKRYGQVLAVDHVSFRVGKGEIFGFLGPNGAGKTTTLRMLTGVIKSNEGSASILGYKSGTLSAKQVAGVVPEMANAYNDLPGWRNLMLMAELYGVNAGKAKERGEELLQGIGLLERKDDLVQGYSKGMKQRLILCMALISDRKCCSLMNRPQAWTCRAHASSMSCSGVSMPKARRFFSPPMIWMKPINSATGWPL